MCQAWNPDSPAIRDSNAVVYLMPGVRLYKDNMSFAFGIKKAAWTRLNESEQQQGAEGKEKYRAVFSASIMF